MLLLQTISYMAERVVGTGYCLPGKMFGSWRDCGYKEGFIGPVKKNRELRGLAYIHLVHGVSHRDVKPRESYGGSSYSPGQAL
ncbi:hypothetical protein IFM89_023459 [Coptis chinensis]|uniref:Uncharacterized protein n=1 Tax=Coptis chinensis TaxID=261450 RepID=A0A835HEP7_9MAGN|nr:hypothetical protein IFM89_023459 [Coptis chinensis]